MSQPVHVMAARLSHHKWLPVFLFFNVSSAVVDVHQVQRVIQAVTVVGMITLVCRGRRKESEINCNPTGKRWTLTTHFFSIQCIHLFLYFIFSSIFFFLFLFLSLFLHVCQLSVKTTMTSTRELTSIIVYHTCTSHPLTESLTYLYALHVPTE